MICPPRRADQARLTFIPDPPPPGMADSKSFAVLNIGSQRIAGALFSKAGSDLVLKRYHYVDIPGDPANELGRADQVKEALAEINSKLKLAAQSAWYSISGHHVFSRFVKLPPVQGDRVAQIVEFEARQNVPFPINEVVWDYEFSQQGSGETEVVLVAIKSDALEEVHQQVLGSKIKAQGVDIAPLALFNAFRYNYPDVDEPAVIIDLGARSTNLVFVEGERFFISNFLVGGAAITSAISKEFGISFDQAELQKCSRGFVAPGGAVQDHADPEIAALSKVIRNAAGNLHTQIFRRITAYRSQQGGAQPRRIFLTGGGAYLGNMVAFLEEKLKLPVEIFNPLRGVTVDRNVQAEPCFLGELVGLALRHAGSTPCELELVPVSVANARDSAKRVPALLLAMLVIWGTLGVAITQQQAKQRILDGKLATLAPEQAKLQDLTNKINVLEGQQAQYAQYTATLEQIVQERSYWVRLLEQLNKSFDNDLIWITSIEVLKEGKSVTPALVDKERAGAAGAAAVAADPSAPYTLSLRGLYRKNDEGEQVVYRYATALAKLPYFEIADFEKRRADLVSAQGGIEEERYAYSFDIKLPIKKSIAFKLP